jgi:hypothetical protein
LRMGQSGQRQPGLSLRLKKGYSRRITRIFKRMCIHSRDLWDATTVRLEESMEPPLLNEMQENLHEFQSTYGEQDIFEKEYDKRTAAGNIDARILTSCKFPGKLRYDLDHEVGAGDNGTGYLNGPGCSDILPLAISKRLV